MPCSSAADSNASREVDDCDTPMVQPSRSVKRADAGGLLDHQFYVVCIIALRKIKEFTARIGDCESGCNHIKFAGVEKRASRLCRHGLQSYVHVGSVYHAGCSGCDIDLES